MKKLTHIALLILGVAGFGLTSGAAEQKIAIFNLRKAFEAYYKTIQSNVALKQEASEADKERSQMIENGRKHEEDWRKLIDKANDQAVSAEQRAQSKQEASQKYAELESDKQSINDFDRMASARLKEKQNLRRTDIVKEIVGVLDAKAKAAGYTMVLDVSGESFNMSPVVLYTNGSDDLTDGIIKELNAVAPPGSLDTNVLGIGTSSIVTNIPGASPVK
jgi:Skp family chaperone for outer membrane proteins